jgi:hypothetical protein
MQTRNERLVPFLVALAVLGIICLAMARLPEAYASRLARNSPFTTSQSGWAYRLLALAAIGQAAYGGFVLLQIDRVRKARNEDERLAAASPAEIVKSLARTAAGMSILTLVYGIASFYLRGERGGFWLFPLISLLQLAWYLRQVGQIARWLEVQPVAEPRRHTAAPWRREPPDYSPPLGR